VGPKKAQRIVEYRTENGPFTSAEQLKDVYGIGERIFTMNSDKIEL
ncbi:TPA: ComEA family DNA-binding protein, partial [Morganella morganii]